MSDEKTHEEPPAQPTPGSPADAMLDGTPARKPPGPVTVMVFVIFALLAVLLAVQFRGRAEPQGDRESAELAELRAELEASRAELNRQLMEAGLPPRQGGPESVDEIAARLRSDVDSLASIAGKFQEMLAERASIGSTRDAELLEAEKSRQALVGEVSRLRHELEAARQAGGENEGLREQLDRLEAERESLAAELSQARAELAKQAEAPDAADYADLQRRYEEARNAKEFFEARVAELEQEAAGD